MGPRLSAFRKDLARDIPAGPFDLVYACYFHTPVDIDRNAIIGRTSEVLSPGGYLVVIDHASSAPWSWGAHDQEFPTANEAVTRLGLGEDLRIVRQETAWREASGPDGQRADVADNVIIAQRL